MELINGICRYSGLTNCKMCNYNNPDKETLRDKCTNPNRKQIPPLPEIDLPNNLKESLYDLFEETYCQFYYDTYSYNLVTLLIKHAAMKGYDLNKSDVKANKELLKAQYQKGYNDGHDVARQIWSDEE